MKIEYLNGAQGGFLSVVEVPDGTSILDLGEIKNFDPYGSTVRVNNRVVTTNYILQEGDRVLVTTQKQAGGFVDKTFFAKLNRVLQLSQLSNSEMSALCRLAKVFDKQPGAVDMMESFLEFMASVCSDHSSTAVAVEKDPQLIDINISFGGVADTNQITSGTTVHELVTGILRRNPAFISSNEKDYIIQVNNEHVLPDYRLNAGDVVLIQNVGRASVN